MIRNSEKHPDSILEDYKPLIFHSKLFSSEISFSCPDRGLASPWLWFLNMVRSVVTFLSSFYLTHYPLQLQHLPHRCGNTPKLQICISIPPLIVAHFALSNINSYVRYQASLTVCQKYSERKDIIVMIHGSKKYLACLLKLGFKSVL